jgi:hypothetical protein
MLAEPFRGVVAKAMEKDPAKRFASVPEMLSALPRPARNEVHVEPLLATAGKRRPETDAARGDGVPPMFDEHGQDARGTQAAAAAAGAAAGAGVGGIGDEPIYLAARRIWRRGRDAWHERPMETRKKVAILLIIFAVAVSTSAPVLAITAVSLLVLYACYFTVRAFVLAHQDRKQSRTRTLPPGTPGGTGVSPGLSEHGQDARATGGTTSKVVLQPEVAATAVTGDWRAAERPRWAPRRLGKRELAAELLLQKPFRVRLAELLGSMLGSTVVAVVMSLVMVILFRFRDVPRSGPLVLAWGIEQSGQLAWLALVTIVGSWAVLIPSKFWEGFDGDAMLRRFILMVIGLGVAALALAGQSYLGVYLPNSHDLGMSRYAGALYHGLGVEDLGTALRCYLAAFGGMFVLLRWWRQADPLRFTRMSLWSLFICGLSAWWVGSFSSFPQPWLIMAACGISVSVQLASPWLHPSQRRIGGST